jgi:hypothetical protein
MRKYTLTAALIFSVLVASKGYTAPLSTLRFPAIPAKVFGSAPFVLKAKAPSGAPVNYISLNEGVAVVEGTSLKIVGAGTAVIVASSALNSQDSSSLISVQRSITVLPRRQKISFSLKSSLKVGERIEAEVTSNSPLSTAPIQILSNNPEVLGVEFLSGRYWITAKSAGSALVTAFQEADQNHLAAKPSFKAVRVTGIRENPGTDGNSGGLPSPTTRELYGGLVLIDIPSSFAMTSDAESYKFGAGDGKGGALVLSVSKYPDMTPINDFAANSELYYNSAGTPIVFREISGNIYTVETTAQISIAKGAARQRYIFFNIGGDAQFDKEQVVWGSLIEVFLPPSTGMWSTPQGAALRKAVDSIRLNPAAGTTPRN